MVDKIKRKNKIFNVNVEKSMDLLLQFILTSIISTLIKRNNTSWLLKILRKLDKDLQLL